MLMYMYIFPFFSFDFMTDTQTGRPCYNKLNNTMTELLPLKININETSFL